MKKQKQKQKQEKQKQKQDKSEKQKRKCSDNQQPTNHKEEVWLTDAFVSLDRCFPH